MDDIASHTTHRRHATAPNATSANAVSCRPKSRAIFDREAEAMAPGLQSIALYSQIAVDHAKGCTIVDVDGNEYLDSLPVSRSAVSATLILTTSNVSTNNSVVSPSAVRDRDPRTFSQFGRRVAARRHHAHPTLLGGRGGRRGCLPSCQVGYEKI